MSWFLRLWLDVFGMFCWLLVFLVCLFSFFWIFNVYVKSLLMLFFFFKGNSCFLLVLVIFLIGRFCELLRFCEFSKIVEYFEFFIGVVWFNVMNIFWFLWYGFYLEVILEGIILLLLVLSKSGFFIEVER